MAEDQNNTSFEPSALPEEFQIPSKLLEQWFSIPPSENIIAPVTRQDLDHFFFGMMRALDASSALDATLVHWSNGRRDDANKSLHESRRLLVESRNQFRQFINGLMFSAVQSRGHGK